MTTSPTTDEVESRAGPRKREIIATLAEKLSRATSAVLTDYRGLTVHEMEELRTTLRNSHVDYMIVKNTLARRATELAGRGELAPAFTGPVGLAVGYDDLSVPARLINDYFRANKRLPITGGWAAGRLLDAPTATALAEMPPLEVLLSQLAGTLQAPLNRLAGSLNAPLSNLAAALDAYRTSLEQGTAA